MVGNFPETHGRKLATNFLFSAKSNIVNLKKIRFILIDIILSCCEGDLLLRQTALNVSLLTRKFRRSLVFFVIKAKKQRNQAVFLLQFKITNQRDFLPS